MRYSRFKAQMEGTPSQTRKPRATGPRQKKTKPDKPPAPESNATEGQQPFFKAEPKVKDEAGVKSEPVVKNEPGVEDEPMEGGIEPTVKPEPVIKKEPRDGDESSWSSAGSVGAGAVEQESSGAAKEFQQDFADFGLEQEAAHQPSSEPIAAEQKSVVKAEPAEEF